MADTSKVGSNPAGDKAPDGARDTGEGVAFPTSDLPGTDHPETAKDQQGVKGMDPRSETGSRSESEPGGKDR